MGLEKRIDMGISPEQQEAVAQEVTTRAVEQVYPSAEELQTALLGERRLTAYMGIDPTAPDMHVGHESQLMKLQRLHQLGHRVILLIGDFTAMIGDPTDKSAARVKLTRHEVLANARGYEEQASKILEFDHPENPVELKYNSEWLGDMDFGNVLELASEFTVQQMLERDMFRRRIDDQKPVGLHEFLYPLMQGWDSVAMDVDIEVGGSDQIFNMLVGSTLIRRHTNKQKFVIAGQLLVDPSGKKIGKTEGNMITLNDDPVDMYHKIMMWGDAITPHALELCSTLPMSEVEGLAQKLASGEMSGLEGKMFLAHVIVSDLHGSDAATTAEEEYLALTNKEAALNTDMIERYTSQDGQSIVEIIYNSGLAPSKSQARRLLASGAVRINGDKISEDWVFTQSEDEVVLQVGKRKRENFRLLNTTNE